MNQELNIEEDAALLIDWENLKYSLLNRDRNWQPNISLLRDTAAKYGRLVIARAYADWQEHYRDASDLYASGVEPVYVPVRRHYGDGQERVKNSIDVKIAVDCVEFCSRFPNIKTYILVSGDQDFVHIINSLRPYGKQTVVIGASWSTSARLAEHVDAMIYYDREVDPREEEVVAVGDSSAATREGTEGTEWAASVFGPPEGEAVLNQAIVELAKEYRSRGQVLLLSQVGLELGRRHPREFSLFGRGRLGVLTSDLAEKGLIQKVDRGLVSWLYLPDEEVPPEPESAPRPQLLSPYAGGVTGDMYKSRYRFEHLTEAEKTDVIRGVAGLEGDFAFLSFSKMKEELQRRLVGELPDVEFQSLLNDLVEREIVIPGPERDWFDAATGATGKFKTFVLNGDHEEVSARVAA